MRDVDFKTGMTVYIPNINKFAKVSREPFFFGQAGSAVEVIFDDGRAAVVPTIACRKRLVLPLKHKNMVVFE